MKGHRRERIEGEGAAIDGLWVDGKLHNIKIQKINRGTRDDGTGWSYYQGSIFDAEAAKELYSLLYHSNWLCDDVNEAQEVA